MAYVKKEASKLSLIGVFFYKKLTRWKPPKTPTPPGSSISLSLYSNDSCDECLRKLYEEDVVEAKLPSLF